MATEGGQASRPGGDRSSDAELSRRLDRLSRQLEAERQERPAAPTSRAGTATGYAAGFRLASEFVAGVLVGAALGWGIDWLAGTSPWGLIVFLLLGFVAGVLNAIRSAGRSSLAATGSAEHGGEGRRGSEPPRGP